MPTTSVSREACQGQVQNARSAGGAIVFRRCYSDGPQYWSPPETYIDPNGLSKTRRRGRATRPRNWELDPSALQDEATALGLEVTALLCRGCGTRRARLIAEGGWPA